MGYFSVHNASETELIVKKSRFIGRAFPVTTEKQAIDIISELKKQHWDARHNCYAYRVRENGMTARFSDDGEPGGTAGMPMMEVLTKQDISNTLVVVTRYFGGILLGTGGLVRAYTESTQMALESAGIVEYRQCSLLSMSVPYPLWGKVEAFLCREAVMETQEYTNQVNVFFWVLSEKVDKIHAMIVELTDGRLDATFVREELRPL